MTATVTTKLLHRLQRGDDGASGELLSVVYEELRALARKMMLDERAAHTLQPTALVHEAWVRLVAESDRSVFDNKRHFLRVAARAMRQVLVDHARSRGRKKRGGGADRVPLDQALQEIERDAIDLVELDDVLTRLGAIDPQLLQVVELRFFAGLTIQQSAEVLGLSPPTVDRSWRFARAWLKTQLGSGEAGG